jgi:hypothetical protein
MSVYGRGSCSFVTVSRSSLPPNYVKVHKHRFKPKFCKMHLQLKLKVRHRLAAGMLLGMSWTVSTNGRGELAISSSCGVNMPAIVLFAHLVLRLVSLCDGKKSR